jgi:alpha-ribazole phosphatase
MILHLVRHGRASDVDGRCIGQTDRPLSDAGRAEADALARTRRVMDMPCVSSDLARARGTASLLTSAPVTEDARLREMHFGVWEDRTWSELEASDATRLQSWMQDWTTVAAPEGESFADVLARMRQWLDALDHTSGELLVVAHAGSIRAAAVLLLELPPLKAFSLTVDHAHVSTFSLSSHGASLLRWNSPGF